MPQSLTQIRTTIKYTYNNASKYFLNFAKSLILQSKFNNLTQHQWEAKTN